MMWDLYLFSILFTCCYDFFTVNSMWLPDILDYYASNIFLTTESQLISATIVCCFFCQCIWPRMSDASVHSIYILKCRIVFLPWLILVLWLIAKAFLLWPLISLASLKLIDSFPLLWYLPYWIFSKISIYLYLDLIVYFMFLLSLLWQ